MIVKLSQKFIIRERGKKRMHENASYYQEEKREMERYR